MTTLLPLPSPRRGWRKSLLVASTASLALAGCADADEPTSNAPEAVVASSQGLSCVTLRRIGGGPTVEDATIATDLLDPTRAGTNFGNNATLAAGTQGTLTRLGLLRFDLSTIPANVPVQSATLSLALAAAQGPGVVQLFQVTAPWSEASVTWNSFGGTYATSVLGSFQPNQYALGAHVTVDLTGVVQAWNAGAQPNHGLVLTEGGGARSNFGASEAGNVASRPALTVCYQPPTCSDGLQNQGEGGVDCGGPCAPCWVDPCIGVTCVALDACHLPGTCDSNTGLCDNPVAPSGTACDDGNACTATDTCDGGGTCQGQNPVTCGPPGACQAAGVCDPQSGQCSYAPLPDGTSCADADVCNGGETCLAGQCTAGTPPVCDDGLDCTVDGCDAATGCTSGVPFFKDHAQAFDPFVFVKGDGTVEAFATTDPVSVQACGPANYSTDYPPATYLYDLSGNRSIGSVTYGPGIHAIERDAAGDTWVLASSYDPQWGSTSWFAKYDPAGNVWWDGPFWTGTFYQGLSVDDLGDVVGAGTDWWTGHLLIERSHGDYWSGGVDWQLLFASGANISVPSHLPHDGAGHTFVPVSFVGTLSGPIGSFTTGAVVLELDASGNLVASTPIGGSGTKTVTAIERDPSSGAIYVSGTFSGAATFGAASLTSAGGTDGFVAKIVAGSFAWARRVGGAGADQAMKLALGPGGSVHVVGTFAQSVDFGAGPVAAPNGAASYVVEYDAAGAYVAEQTMRGVIQSVGIAVDCSNHVVLAGTTVQHYPVSNVDRLGVHGEAVAPTDGFVAKLGDPITDCGPGSCSGGQYCDACGCRPASDGLSVAACGCNLVNPAAGAGDCSSGAYCEGTHSANPQCHPADSAESYALCQGGSLNAQCLPSLPPKRVFVSSQVYPAGIGTAAADAACQSLAQAAGLGGSFKAWVSNGSGAGQDAKDRVGHGTFERYELVDGTLVAKTWSQFLSPTHLHAIDQNELGGAAPHVTATGLFFWGAPYSFPSSVWTGTADDGWGAWDYDMLAGGSISCHGVATCTDGLSYQGSPQYYPFGGVLGTMTAGSGWSSAGWSDCQTDQLPFYCVEE